MTRKVCTAAGLAALMSGATFEEALEVDAAQLAKWAAEDEAEREAAERRAERARLNIAEQKLRVNARVRRLRKSEGDDE